MENFSNASENSLRLLALELFPEAFCNLRKVFTTMLKGYHESLDRDPRERRREIWKR